MRRPNHASRFEGIAKTNLQASRASDTETLQSQVNKAAKKRLSLSGLEILHGRQTSYVRICRRDGVDHPDDHGGQRFGSAVLVTDLPAPTCAFVLGAPKCASMCSYSVCWVWCSQLRSYW